MITKTNVTTSATLISAAKDRKWAAISNLSDTTVFVAVEGSSGVTADSGAYPGIPIQPQATLTLEHIGHSLAYDRAFYAIHGGTGNKVVVVQEG